MEMKCADCGHDRESHFLDLLCEIDGCPCLEFLIESVLKTDVIEHVDRIKPVEPVESEEPTNPYHKAPRHSVCVACGTTVSSDRAFCDDCYLKEGI